MELLANLLSLEHIPIEERYIAYKKGIYNELKRIKPFKEKYLAEVEEDVVKTLIQEKTFKKIIELRIDRHDLKVFHKVYMYYLPKVINKRR